MNILVTGANGQLGSQIKSIIEIQGNGKPNHGVWDDNYYIFAGHEDLDVTNEDKVKRYIKDNHITVVINCAAYTAVDKAESDEEEALKLNALAPKYIAEACNNIGAVLIHISTDYVFDGETPSHRSPTDAINPQSVYGKTKWMGEQNIINAGCKYLIFRTSWLYSERGNNFVAKILKKIKDGEDVKVVNDQIGSPTFAFDLAEFLIEICKVPQNLLKTGIYHYANEGAISWFDFAKAIEENYRIGVHINRKSQVSPCKTEDFATAAKRPKYSVLDTTLTYDTFGIPMHYWKESLDLCITYILAEL